MEKPRNPFILGHRIERPYFCDRVDEQKALVSAVVNGRNVVLISPRRMGKTSLVYVALHDSEEISADYMTLSVDILQTNSLAEFTYLFGKCVFESLRSRGSGKVREFLAALKSLKGTFGFDPVTGSPVFDIQLGDIRRPEFTLDEIFSFLEHMGKPVVVVIDEFQQVTKYPEKNTEALLRSHIQRSANATFVFAGSEQTLLQEMFVSSRRPFYNSSEIMHLAPIAEELYVSFARGLFRDYGRDIDAEAIEWAYRLFDGNTFYLQRAMNGAFADTEEGDNCDVARTARVVRSMLASNEVIFREILSNVSVSQKSVLLAIAKEKMVKSPTGSVFIRSNMLASASSVQSAVGKLTKSGLVTKSAAGYAVSDPLFRIFINGLYSVPEF